VTHAAPSRATERQHLADCEARLAETTAILARLHELHRPFGIYDPCDHQHTEDDVAAGRAIDIGDGYGCPDSLLYTVCRHCCTSRGGQTETCASSHRHAPGMPACPTVAILGGAVPH
jgi:hypothetical protein